MAIFGDRDIKNLDQKVQAGRLSLDVAATMGPDGLTSALSNVENELFAATKPLAAKGRGAEVHRPARRGEIVWRRGYRLGVGQDRRRRDLGDSKNVTLVLPEEPTSHTLNGRGVTSAPIRL